MANYLESRSTTLADTSQMNHSRANSTTVTPNRSRVNTLRLEPMKVPQDWTDYRQDARDGDIEEDEHNLGTEAAQSVVGVSIGREQTRLMSPTTPAVEKSAALEAGNSWGFFDDAGDEEQEEMLRETLYDSIPPPSQPELQETTQEPSRAEMSGSPYLTLALPSPWTTAKPLTWVGESKFKDRRASKPTRSRATSAASMLSELNLKRLLPTGLGLPSISPKPPEIGSQDGAQESLDRTLGHSRKTSRSNTLFARNMPWGGSISLRGRSRSRSREVLKSPEANEKPEPTHRRMISSPLLNYSSHDMQNLTATGSQPSTGSPEAPSEAFRSPIPRLQRSTSHDSIPHSVLSRVSSFGENGKWDHIDEQVNTRFKAIKDTISDSLPSIPSLKLSAFRPDSAWKREVQSPRAASTFFAAAASRSRQNSAASTAPPTPLKPEFSTSKFSALDEALDSLTGDIVLLGGYRGSILRSAEPPHRQLWVPIKVGLNIRKVDMEVGLDLEDEENMEKRIFPSGMLTHIGPIDISRRLFKRLRGCRNYREGRLRVHDYGYDWRLSPELLSGKLLKFIENLECNKAGTPIAERGATVIAHSLGGLITRHAVNQKPELFAGVLYAGTPQHCVNILGPFRNGDEVLLSSKVLTAQVNFTLRTSFALLPESGQCFIDKDTKEQYRVDFFNIESWKQYAFSPCICRCLPPISSTERRTIFGSISGTLSSSFGTSHTSVNSNTNSTTNLNHPSMSSSNKTTTSTSTDATTRPSDHSLPSEALTTKADSLIHPTSLTLDMQMNSPPPPATLSTLPLPVALAYLERTLRETLRFKRFLAHNASHQSSNLYPPHSVLYCTSLPTVYGARVAGREGIKHADAYDNLAFASGDGVVLARAAMLPRGYKVAEGCRVRTERGHVGMLSDLEAVGRCLGALVRARREGIGLGVGVGEAKGGEEMELQKRGRERERAREGQQSHSADGRGDGKPF